MLTLLTFKGFQILAPNLRINLYKNRAVIFDTNFIL